jgi:hypothetical protein
MNILGKPYTISGSILLNLQAKDGNVIDTVSSNSWTNLNVTVNSTGGKNGNPSISFPASSAYLRLPITSSLQLGTSDYTLAVSYKINTLPYAGVLFIISNSTSKGSYVIYPFGKNGTYGIMIENDTFPISTTQTTMCTIGNWHNILVCRKNGTTYMYHNDDLIGSTTSVVDLNSVYKEYIIGDGVTNTLKDSLGSDIDQFILIKDQALFPYKYEFTRLKQY